MHSHHGAYLDEYAYRSGLAKYSAGGKFFFTVTVLILCLTFHSPAVSLFIILSMAALLVGPGRLSPGIWLHMLFLPFLFIFFSGIALYFTAYDIRQVLSVSLQALGAVSSFFFLTLSTPVSEIVEVLSKCHVPKLFIELMYLIYRFIFVLTDVWNSMHTAAEARLGYVDFKTSCKTFGALAGNLFVLSMRKANIYYDAMEARCYTGNLRFLETKKPLRLPECLFFFGYVCCLFLIRRWCG